MASCMLSRYYAASALVRHVHGIEHTGVMMRAQLGAHVVCDMQASSGNTISSVGTSRLPAAEAAG